MKTENRNVIVSKSSSFAVAVVKYCEMLESQKEFVMAKQLLRSGTSVGANVREAQHAESLSDFIHKLKIAAKEAEETQYWLEVLHGAKNYPNTNLLLDELDQILAILTKIIATCKTKLLLKKKPPIG